MIQRATSTTGKPWTQIKASIAQKAHKLKTNGNMYSTLDREDVCFDEEENQDQQEPIQTEKIMKQDKKVPLTKRRSAKQIEIAFIGHLKINDVRPHVKGKIGDLDYLCMLDTGATVSVLNIQTVRRIERESPEKITKLPMTSTMNVSGVTGHSLGMEGYYELSMSFDGYVTRVPIIGCTGLPYHKIILGVDFLERNRVIINAADKVIWIGPYNNQRSYLWNTHALLYPVDSVELAPRSAQTLKVRALSPRGANFQGEAVCEPIHNDIESFGVWECLVKPSASGVATIVVSNLNDQPIRLAKGMPVAKIHSTNDFFMSPVDAEVGAVFGQIKDSSKQPRRGRIAPLTPEDQKKMLDEMRISAPEEYRQSYVDLILKYHDVCSKNPFDLGRTDVIQHSLRLTSKDPIHVR